MAERQGYSWPVAVKLHRCRNRFLKGSHPCWKVQHALDEAGIDYEVERHPWLPRSRRRRLRELTGQQLLPAIELKDEIIREESEEMVRRIESGELAARIG